MKTIQFNINANEINMPVLNAIKAYYDTKDIEITVKEAPTSQSPILMFHETPEAICPPKVQKPISFKEQLDFLVQFTKLFYISSICYAGEGRQDVIEAIASKNIKVNITNGPIADRIACNFWCDEDVEPTPLPKWTQELPIYSQIEGIPQEPLYLLDSLGTDQETSHYIKTIVNQSNAKVIMLLNNLDISSFECYHTYTWMDAKGIKIGLSNREPEY